MYTVNDFFCGCGGLGLGLRQAGFKILKAWDFDKYAVQTYRENISDHVEQADIRELCIEDIPKADAWAFGFPCQDISVDGKQGGIKLECTDCGEVWKVDYKHYTGKNTCPKCGGRNYKAATRSGMFFKIMRLLQEAGEKEPDKLPKILIAENVKALGPYLPVLAAEYGRAGYKSYYQLFNSKWWGVPQNRERYIVIGIRDTMEGAYRYPAEQHEWIPKLSSVLEKDVPESFYIDDDKAQKIIDQVLFTLTAQNLHGVIQRQGKKPKIIMLAHKGSGGQRGRIHSTEGIIGAIAATDYNGPKLILERVCEIAPTATAVAGVTHHIKIFDYSRFRVRKLTPTEYGRLQGFPMDTWRQVVSNSQAYKQFGNAVTVPLAEAIGKSIIEFLREQEAEDGKDTASRPG